VRKAGSLVELGQVYLAEQSAGFYTLQIETIDQAKHDTARAAKSFYFFSDDPVARKNTEEKEPTIDFDAMSGDSLDSYFEYAAYLANREERSTYKALREPGKRTFLKEFWVARDSAPGTAFNEFMEDYYSRVFLANESYSNVFKKGWKTDKGRVLILYGQPDDIQRHTSTGEWEHPYEVWRYFRLEGGADFIFSDESGYGDFKLVHSTATNEIHDAQWEDRL
jgi:GWxTD domain-containing protein